MKATYTDITDRLGEPLWWDENGTPRYNEFSPDGIFDPYAQVVVFLLIGCQNCDKRMKVAMSWSRYDFRNAQGGYWEEIWGKPDGWRALYKHVESGPYGDPPEHGDWCGETMNSIPLEVLEFWHKETDDSLKPTWRRVSEFEGKVNCPWWETK